MCEPPALIKKSSTSNAAPQARQETSKHASKVHNIVSSAPENHPESFDPRNVHTMVVKMRPHRPNFWQQQELKKQRKALLASIGSGSSSEEDHEEDAVVAKKAKLEPMKAKPAEKKQKTDNEKVRLNFLTALRFH